MTNALSARDENKLTLAGILGLAEEEAETLLSETILLTYEKSDGDVSRFANYISEILSRTFDNVISEPSSSVSAEIVFGTSKSTSNAHHVYVYSGGSAQLIISENRPGEAHGLHSMHPAFHILSACYVSAFTMRRLIGVAERALPSPPTIELDFPRIFPEQGFLGKHIDVGTVFLAGAGAIGNSFLYALRTFDVEGTLHICDGDKVSHGNLNRCIWFHNDHVDHDKATVLSHVAQAEFPRLRLVPHNDVLAAESRKSEGANWLDRLVVAVDSRRARRALNAEIPGEVFDASTTDIREAAFHFHKRPLGGLACLECAYPRHVSEKAHEQHVADALGVGLSDVEELAVSPRAATAIVAKYHHRTPEDLVGQSYDTLFKELCGKGELTGKDETRILAPFAFVSVLAGTVLAIEFARRLSGGSRHFNYFRLSPWSSPVLELQQLNPTNPKCTFCSDPDKAAFADRLWRR